MCQSEQEHQNGERNVQNDDDHLPNLNLQPEADEHVEEETETEYIPKNSSPRRPSNLADETVSITVVSEN